MTDSNFRESDKSVYGLETREQADALYELTLHGLKVLRVEEDFLVRVEERSDGKFDLLVLQRVN